MEDEDAGDAHGQAAAARRLGEVGGERGRKEIRRPVPHGLRGDEPSWSGRSGYGARRSSWLGARAGGWRGGIDVSGRIPREIFGVAEAEWGWDKAPNFYGWTSSINSRGLGEGLLDPSDYNRAVVNK